MRGNIHASDQSAEITHSGPKAGAASDETTDVRQGGPKPRSGVFGHVLSKFRCVGVGQGFGMLFMAG